LNPDSIGTRTGRGSDGDYCTGSGCGPLGRPGMTM
jgi:hypothetical protein